MKMIQEEVISISLKIRTLNPTYHGLQLYLLIIGGGVGSQLIESYLKALIANRLAAKNTLAVK